MQDWHLCSFRPRATNPQLRWNTMVTNDARFFLQNTRKWRAVLAGEAWLWILVAVEQCEKTPCESLIKWGSTVPNHTQTTGILMIHYGNPWEATGTCSPPGLDTEGHVYILCGDEPPDTKQITRMMTSKASMEESPASVKRYVKNDRKGWRSLPVSGVLW